MCMIDGAEDSATVHNDRQIKHAKKPHKCTECRREIAVGEGYRRIDALYDGWVYGKICSHCQVSAQWLVEQCGGFLIEGVYEDIEEHCPVYRLARLYRLKIGMQRKWRRFDRTGLMPIPTLPPLVQETAHG